MAVSACFIALLPSLLADSASGFIVSLWRFLPAPFRCWRILPLGSLLVINGFCLYYVATPFVVGILPLGSLVLAAACCIIAFVVDSASGFIVSY
jgi:hypothetical protein